MVHTCRPNEEGGPPPRQGVLLPPDTAAPTPCCLLAAVLPHCPGFLLFSVAVASELPSLVPFFLPLNVGVPWSLGGFTDSCGLKGGLLTPRPVSGLAFSPELHTLWSAGVLGHHI